MFVGLVPKEDRKVALGLSECAFRPDKEVSNKLLVALFGTEDWRKHCIEGMLVRYVEVGTEDRSDYYEALVINIDSEIDYYLLLSLPKNEDIRPFHVSIVRKH